DEGYLYVGVKDLLQPQDLSILFQMASGSEDRGIEKPEVRWAYLRGGRWEDFKATEILSDSTNGMVDSGIIRLSMPDRATGQNSLMPGGMHWLRARLQKGAAAIPDTVDVKTQAVTATFKDQDNAPDHLKKPLPAFAVTELVDRDPAIAGVLQPYSSFHGRPSEDAGVFYTRVSERLRHKQRAIAPWDYERLVLDRFPEIFQVKCLNGLEKVIQGNGPGSANVTVVVVPDVSNTAPFFPLEPRAPLYLLEEIESYLRQYIPPFVDLTVQNPRYEQITYRVAVRFKGGYHGLYINQLNEEIKRFLTPWAYEADLDLPFGNCIYHSSIIYFIEKRPYVDYVAKVKLFEQVALGQGAGDEEMTYRQVESNAAWVQNPDAIFISAPEHVIDVITTEKYRPEDFEGIGYMMVGLDFEVD
ncbi:MAG: phage baseplate protein, partial [Deltaproteobacteria bacterium]|nr:phage baseplate protein [Deltaproteobacteria bacterium]